MFKLVVLCALVAIAVAKPGLHHEVVEISAPVAYALPAAVSHTYRKDVISKPAAVTYVAPAVVQKAVVASPVAYAAPVAVRNRYRSAKVVSQTYVAPAAVSHTYREDTISKSAVAYHAPAVVAAPVVQKTIVAAPVAYAVPSAVSHSYRSDVYSKPIVAKTIVATAPAHYEYAAPAHFAYAAHAPVVNAW